MVRTRIVPVGEDPVELDYRLSGADGSWRVIDVFMNGTVSELALRRSEYSSVYKRDGFESLVSSLEGKIVSP
jgi:phospholipid transport system substrate-binding protein